MAVVTTYVPLRDNEIRLVDFAAGDGESILTNVSLKSTSIHYVALSYCWGTDNCLHRFELNDQVIIVTSSLLEILNDLQRRNFRGKIWADAVCIDQNNNREKAEQIALMGKIFSRADTVVAWLRLPFGNPDCLNADLLDGLLSKISEIDDQQYLDFLAVINEKSLPPRNSEIWDSLVDLFANPWYQRLWVLQEAVLAKRLIIRFGSLEWSLEKAADLVTKLLRFGFALYAKPSRGNRRNLTGPPTVHSVIDLYTAGKLRNSDLLAYSQALVATNDCDKVFSLYNLGNLRDTVALDSSAAPHRVFIQAAKAVMKYDNHGLCMLGLVESPKRLVGLPSWVPDLRHRSIGAIGQVGRNSRAGTASDTNTPPQVVLMEDDDAVALSGFTLDRIQRVVAEPSAMRLDLLPQDDMSSRAKQSLDWFDTMLQFAEETLPIGKSEAKTILYKTLVMDLPSPLKTDLRFSDKVMTDLDQIRSQYQECMQGNAWNVTEQWYLVESITLYTQHRKLFATESGSIGLGPGNAQRGDSIVIFYGDTVPEVVRKRSEGTTYQFLGQAYIENVMEGQAMRRHEASGESGECFVLD